MHSENLDLAAPGSSTCGGCGIHSSPPLRPSPSWPLECGAGLNQGQGLCKGNPTALLAWSCRQPWLWAGAELWCAEQARWLQNLSRVTACFSLRTCSFACSSLLPSLLPLASHSAAQDWEEPNNHTSTAWSQTGTKLRINNVRG